MTRRGAVRVREHDIDTELPTDAIDGEIVVDLDADTPQVGLPTEVGTVYADGGHEEPGASEEQATATDGGYPASARRIETTGVGLDPALAKTAGGLGAFGLVASGWLLGQPNGAAGALFAVIAALALYIGARAYWGGQR